MFRLIFFAIPILWWLGGMNKLSWARDIFVPVLLGLGIALKGHPWLGLICCAAYNTVRIGYGSYDPENDDKPSFLALLTRDRGGYWIRAIYGVIVASAGTGALLAGHAIPLWIYLAYIVENAIVGYLVSKLRFPVLAADLCVGAAVGSILFLL